MPVTWGFAGSPPPVEGTNYPGASSTVTIPTGQAVTLTANHSCNSLTITQNANNQLSTINVGTFTLNVGTGGVALTGGPNDKRQAILNVGGGTVNIDGNLSLTC